MDESERRSQEEKARRQAAEDARHDEAVKHAAPAWGFAFAPVAAAVGAILLGLGRYECYGSVSGALHPMADKWWCVLIPASSSNDGNLGTILGAVIGLVAYVLIYAAVYLRR